MKISDLSITNCEYDAAEWINLRAVYEGGKSFRARITEFLPQNPQEPGQVYELRKSLASYENHVGPIINYFVSWLFSMSFSVKAKDKGSAKELPLPDFYKGFHADIGDSRSLPAFIKEQTTKALQVGASHVILEKRALAPGEPEPKTLADYEKAGLDNVCLKLIEREQILNWSMSDDGRYEWAVVHAISEVYGNPLQGTYGKKIVEQWRIYDAENVTLFEIQYEKNHRPPLDTDVPVKSTAPHGFPCVPILNFELINALRIGKHTFEPQIQHFRLMAGLDWSIRQTCYAMPVINCESTDEAGAPRMGTGYYMLLGKDDKFGWTAPPAAPYDVLQKNITARREEIYRINHSMAQALDNNAETVGRSADSKNADTAATRIVLNALGQEVCRFVEHLYQTLSMARGEKDIEWSIEGFSGYDTTTAGSLISNAMQANLVGIPSKTFRREISTKIAQALLPEADQAIKDDIRNEIRSFEFAIVDPVSTVTAKAELERAKAAAEPIKADAAMEKAKHSPQPNAGPTPSAPQQKS